MTAVRHTVTVSIETLSCVTLPEPACSKLTIVEHATFVETAVVTTRDGGGTCTAVGYGRHASASLMKALGARVLIEQKTGAPIVVTPA